MEKDKAKAKALKAANKIYQSGQTPFQKLKAILNGIGLWNITKK